MVQIATGMVHSLILLIALNILIFIGIRLGEKKPPTIRSMAGLDAIKEAVGRAAEMGKPVHLGTGMGQLIDQYAPQTIAGLAIITYAAREAAKVGVPVIYNCAVAHVLPAAEAAIKEVYVAEGAQLDESYTFRYVGDNAQAYFAGCNATFARDKPAANIMAGAWFWEALTVGDAARQAGAINIGAGARIYAFPYFLATCDYTLIGEEMFAAGAYLSGNASLLGSIRGQDLCKILVIVIIVLCLVLGDSILWILRT